MKERIKKYFRSKTLLQKLKSEAASVDKAKWAYPKITVAECFSMGLIPFKEDENGRIVYKNGSPEVEDNSERLVDNIFVRIHPDLKDEYYDSPFTAGPKNEEFKEMRQADKDRLMGFLRNLWSY